jgi:hypothetical protein
VTLNQDACPAFIMTVQKHGSVVTRSAQDLEGFCAPRALERHLPFNYDCLTIAEGSNGCASGWIAVIGFQAGLLRSRGRHANEYEAC